MGVNRNHAGESLVSLTGFCSTAVALARSWPLSLFLVRLPSVDKQSAGRRVYRDPQEQ